MIGKTLGHYQITGELGKGGMGEVYRARDTKLEREVALKVLPKNMADDAERIARLRREARTLASLHHRRIASLFGLEEIEGMTVLVMELVEGQDLAQRLEHGAVPVEDTVRIGLQIAEGLEVAHESGVIHRDLKPANVKVSPQGEVKILDFGLARAYAGDPAQEANLSMSPTITAAMTQMGVILGTAAYMSPEQAKGKPVDRRSDIWAFGVILFELLTGKQLFLGETATEIMADVMKSEVDWSSLPKNTPPKLRELLHRCLDRDPVTRLRDIGEARVALGRPDVEEPAALVAKAERARPSPLPWIVAALAIGAAAVGFLWPRDDANPVAPMSMHARLVNDATSNLRQGDGRAVTISPDGMQVVTHGNEGDRTLLFSRRLDAFDWVPLRGTEGGNIPTFSPDGQWIVFVRSSQFMKISLSGGAPVSIGSTPASVEGITWADDGFIYYATGGGIWKLPDFGGEPVPVLETNNEDLPSLRNPCALPGSRALLLSTFASRGENGRLYALDLASGEAKDLGTLGMSPVYVHPGMIAFAQGSQVMAARFDPDALEITSPPVPALQRAWIESSPQMMHLAVSQNGTVAYLPALAGARPSILLVDRAGTERDLMTGALPFSSCSDPRLSPDGSRLTISVDGFQIWILDLASETPTLVSENGFYPTWTTDGSHLIYGSTRNRSYDLYRIPTDLSRSEELLLDHDNNLRSAASAPDGTFIFREEIPGKGMDLRIWTDMEDESTIAPLLEGPDDELAPAISPNGRWIAYVSDLSSRDEIYVTTFPKPGARIQISANGGTSPAWSPDGKELFYMDGDALMAANVEDEETLRVISRQTLFAGPYLQYRWYRQYDVFPDGEQFILIRNPLRGDVEIITHWAEELEHALGAQG